MKWAILRVHELINIGGSGTGQYWGLMNWPISGVHELGKIISLELGNISGLVLGNIGSSSTGQYWGFMNWPILRVHDLINIGGSWTGQYWGFMKWPIFGVHEPVNIEGSWTGQYRGFMNCAGLLLAQANLWAVGLQVAISLLLTSSSLFGIRYCFEIALQKFLP